MPAENFIETDVLVIGGSMAGLLAAIKARDEGVSVTLVEKSYAGRSGAALFATFFQVFNPEWGHDLDAWTAQVAKTGEYMNNPAWTEVTLRESYAMYRDLVSWGVEFDKGEDGRHKSHHTRGVMDALMFSAGRGFLPALRKRAEAGGARIMDRIMVTDLMKHDGRVTGAVGFHTVSGDFYVFQAKATVMCTGGGALGGYEHVGSRLAFNGETMAYQAGAEISGKEFSLTGMGVNIEPCGTPVKKISLKGRKIKAVSAGFHPQNVDTYVDAEGNQVGRGKMAAAVHLGRAPFIWDLDDADPDEVSRNRYITSQDVLDPRELEVDVTKGGLYSGATRVESYIGHAVEGGGSGIRSTDLNGATTVLGLFAAGDCYHSRAVGAMYPGFGMGTRNAAVTGARAGHAAAGYARGIRKIALDREQLAGLKAATYLPLERPGGFDSDWVTLQLKSIMVPYYVWIIKHGARLQAALTLVEFLRDHVGPMIYAKPRDAHGLRIAHETKSRIVAVEMMLRSAIFRTESRGVHYREDYPRRDDPGWLALVKLREKDGRMALAKEAFPQSAWPDLTIPYRQRYPAEFLNEGYTPEK